MPLEIRFIRVTMTTEIAVCSRTEQEAEAITRDVLGDKLGIQFGWETPEVVSIEFTEGLSVAEDETVWGEAVPEEACEVGQLREWLKERG